jgi:hypothetical protein
LKYYLQWHHLCAILSFSNEGGIRPEHAVIFVHGHGGDGWQGIHRWGFPLANIGLLVILPTLFGYGQADEHADFNGPSTVSDLESVARQARDMFECDGVADHGEHLPHAA